MAKAHGWFGTQGDEPKRLDTSDDRANWGAIAANFTAAAKAIRDAVEFAESEGVMKGGPGGGLKTGIEACEAIAVRAEKAGLRGEGE